MGEVKRFVGIDVAKAALDVFVGSAGIAFTVANYEVGIRDLISQLVPTDFVILEATGGLETPVASLRRQHLDQLAPPGNQCFERLGVFVG